MEDEATSRVQQRQALFDLVKIGKLSPAEAEVRAREFGLGSLLNNPAMEDLDGFAERHWSLVMALAWVAFGRNPDHVRRYFPPYMARLLEWQRLSDGYVPARAYVPTIYGVVKNLDDDRYQDALAAAFKSPPDRLGWSKMTAKFRSGEVRTRAQLVNEPTRGVVPIPQDDWLALMLREPEGRLADPLSFADGSPVYFNVTVERDQLLNCFPVAGNGSTVDDEAAPTPAVPEVSANPPHQPRPRGRRPKYPWNAFIEECQRVWDYHGGFSEDDREFARQADLERIMMQWCSDREDDWGVGGPGLTQARKHIGAFLKSVGR